jgi:fatty acid desaturase
MDNKLLWKSIKEGVSMSALVVGVACVFVLVIVSFLSWLISHPWVIYGAIAFLAFVYYSIKWSREFYLAAKKGGTNEKKQNPFSPIS